MTFKESQLNNEFRLLRKKLKINADFDQQFDHELIYEKNE